MINEKLNEQKVFEFIKYNDAANMVKEEISRALTSSPVLVRKYTKHLAVTSGKNIRAASLLVCAENSDGLIHKNAIKFAAAIELFHLATLVHDDVIDDAGIRRGDVTLQRKYGKRTAVICGDYLFCAALKLAGSVSGKEDYLNLDIPDYLSRVCLGELNQHINSGFIDLSVYQYLKIISGKTAALFEASFHAGAILGGFEKPVIGEFKRLGHYIGMIFQMTDDCLDFVATKDMAKKPVQSDFEQGVVTLPLIHAFKNIPGLKEKAKDRKISRAEINDAVDKTDGLDYTRNLSRKYYDKSLKIIYGLDITKDKKEKLISIIDKAYWSV